MAEIGCWMKKFHQNFLDDSYLKYIGWTLHDKVSFRIFIGFIDARRTAIPFPHRWSREVQGTDSWKQRRQSQSHNQHSPHIHNRTHITTTFQGKKKTKKQSCFLFTSELKHTSPQPLQSYFIYQETQRTLHWLVQSIITFIVFYYLSFYNLKLSIYCFNASSS